MRRRRTSPNGATADDRLRICWLVPAFPESIDDPNYSFLGREARELVERDLVDLLVVVVDGGWDGEQPDGFEVRLLPRPDSPRAKVRDTWLALTSDPKRLARFCMRPKGEFPTLWRIGGLIQLIRDWHPDLVHSHFAVPNGTCGVPVAKAVGAASVVSLRGVDLMIDEDLGYGFRLDETYDNEFRASISQVDLCLTATEHMRMLAIDAGAGVKRAVKLPNSVSLSKRACSEGTHLVLRPPGANGLFLSVGHLIPLKGFDRGIRSLLHLPRDHHYVIVGEGSERNALERLAISLGVAERTHFIGEVPPATVDAWMKEADCYWFLSIIEAFGNVLIEAFAAGTPIVGTPVGVAPELAEADAAVALLEVPDDPIALASLTKSLLAMSPPHGRGEVLKGFSSESRSFNLVELYRLAALAEGRWAESP